MIGQPDTTPIPKELIYATEKARENLGLIELEYQRLDKLNRSLNKDNVNLAASIDYLTTKEQQLSDKVSILEEEVLSLERNKSNLETELQSTIEKNGKLNQSLEQKMADLLHKEENITESNKELTDSLAELKIQTKQLEQEKRTFEAKKQMLRDVLTDL